MVNVFAYGSNMCMERILARVASVTPVTTGYVTHRRLAFHKRSVDGSAKADALYTGSVQDRVWGVVLSLQRHDKRVLDDFEMAYDEEQVVVVGADGKLKASIYVARAEAIDASLKPYSWYHGFVTHGARQHRLPAEYIETLQRFDCVPDPDSERNRRNLQLLGARVLDHGSDRGNVGS